MFLLSRDLFFGVFFVFFIVELSSDELILIGILMAYGYNFSAEH